MRGAVLALLATGLAAPAAAASPLEYQAALRAALRLQGCAVDLGTKRDELAFSRQLGLAVGSPALEVSNRAGAVHAGLRQAVADMATRGQIEVDGRRMTLTDCDG